VAAESFGGFDAAPGDADEDSPLTQPATQFGEVIAFVGVQLGWSALPRARTGLHCGDGLDQGFEPIHVVGVGPGDPAGQRQASRVGQQVDL
jgi:hypothetical protein